MLAGEDREKSRDYLDFRSPPRCKIFHTEPKRSITPYGFRPPANSSRGTRSSMVSTCDERICTRLTRLRHARQDITVTCSVRYVVSGCCSVQGGKKNLSISHHNKKLKRTRVCKSYFCLISFSLSVVVVHPLYTDTSIYIPTKNR